MLKKWLRRKFLNWLDNQLDETRNIIHLNFVKKDHESRLRKLEQAEEERQVKSKEKRIYGGYA